MNFANRPNIEQSKVIQQTEGLVLVIAGPGSGKTNTLLERVVHLIEMEVDVADSCYMCWLDRQSRVS